MTDKAQGAGQIALAWWQANLRPQDETGRSRGLRARLRRAKGPVEMLAEEPVHQLGHRLQPVATVAPETLAALAGLLAEVEVHDRHRIAQGFGAGDPKPLSALRFQRLLRCEDRSDLAQALRRALPLIDARCNVAALAEDFLFWGEAPRIRWCFDYYGAAVPKAAADPDLEETE